MEFRFAVCEPAMADIYLTFLLEHDEELNLPYDFGTRLSFIASPLEFGKAILCFNDETREVIGAVGLVYGTGANDYEDTDVCQIEAAFIRKPFRRTKLFGRVLEYVTALLAKEGVRQIRFCTPTGQSGLTRMLSKLGGDPQTIVTKLGALDAYQIDFEKWLDCSKRYARRRA